MPPGAEDAGVASQDRRPVIVVAEPDHCIAQVFETLRHFNVAPVSVGIGMYRPVDIDDGVMLAVHEIGACPRLRDQFLGTGWQAMVACLEKAKPRTLEFGASQAKQPFQVLGPGRGDWSGRDVRPPPTG